MSDPYPTDRAYVRDELARLDCRLRLEVDRFEGPIDEFGALYVSEQEVRDLLTPETTDGAGRETRAEAERLDRYTNEIRERRRASADAGATVSLDRLVDRFDLPPLARDALLVATAPDIDEKYATVYAYLQDDATRRRPTVGFILGVLDEADHLRDRTLFTAGSPLVDDNLVRVGGDGPLPTQTVSVDPRVVGYLLGEEATDPRLSSVVSTTDPTRSPDSLDVSDDARRVFAALNDERPTSSPPMIALHGPAGTGKAARVEAMCAERDGPLLTLDAGRVDDASFGDVLARLEREARLRGSAVTLDGVLDDTERATAAVDRLDTLPTAVFLTGTNQPSTDLRSIPTDHDFVPISVDQVDYEARRRYWANRDDRPPDLDPERVASTFRLSRGAIDAAMDMAAASARAAGTEPTAEHVYAACRAQSSEELTDLATRVDPVYDWEDIVLPAQTETQLREVSSRLADRGTVYVDWGFADETSLGNGLIALFSGPSGTGKTMAAEVIANAAGLDLYKIDLAAVVSKYVGETESNLGRIFDEAADSDAVLLFDEADALFGERSEVSDAHDRYANVEVDYLLQRVEEHDGAVLLTTNLESNIDDAFLRRVHLSVDFPLPDRAARAEIWRRVFPADAPVGDLDYDYLARLDFTGGNIRNIALSAAFFAADEGTTVEMEQVVRAAKRECQKIGRPIQTAQFEEYRDVLESG
ncbi:ATP-binding protein [Haloarcula sp. 1CSR25-25]|uniref:AAA family ATPase n=1 Tax=Haloarcula sp. 1CSR25-25 TaxID=2862545 RepID=UPI0028940E31|nr:ATP-binding protein [Haloarcula sp. 1CSR25-25]MDT3435985.1 AAA family ATPase [Haloarcula sp. 1CSR25-25]